MSALTFHVSNRHPNSHKSRNSRNSRNGPTRKVRPNKMFCKVCFDAGKPEVVFTCHYVRDTAGPGGKVVCPTLLATKCNYCKETGHFKSHCPSLKEKKATREYNNARRRREAVESRKRHVESGAWSTVGKPAIVERHSNKSWLSRKQQERVSEEKFFAKMQRRAVIRGPTKKTENRFVFDSDSEDDEETTVDYTRLSVGKPVALQGARQSKSTVQAAAPAAAPAAKTSPSDKILQQIKKVEAQLAEVQDELGDSIAPTTSTK